MFFKLLVHILFHHIGWRQWPDPKCVKLITSKEKDRQWFYTDSKKKKKKEMNKKNKRINSAKNKIRKEGSEKKYLFSLVCGIRHIG